MIAAERTNENARPPTAWARHYTEAYGACLVPIPLGTKGPSSEGWNKPGRYYDSPDGAGRYWLEHPTEGMGVVLEPSRLVSLDLDNPECAAVVFERLGIDLGALTANAPEVQGNPERRRLMFRAPTGIALRRKTLAWPAKEEGAKPTTVFELRAGPVQDVLPPTIHPETQQPYRWIRAPWQTDGFPELPAALLALWLAWDEKKPTLEAACPWAAPVRPKSRQKEQRTAQRTEGQSVIEAFNEAHDIRRILQSHDYEEGRGGRWLAPESSSGLPGVVILKGDDGRERAFSHHGSDPIAEDGQAHDAFDLFKILEHGNDESAAVRAAGEMLGIVREDSTQAEEPFSAFSSPSSATENVDEPAFSAFSAFSAPPSISWPEPLAPDAYHGIAGTLVRTIEPHSEADPAALLGGFLVGFGNLCGSSPHIRVEGDHHPPRTNIGMVGETAKGRKGTSWGQTRRVFKQVDPTWTAGQIVEGLSSGEGLIWHVRDPVERDGNVIDPGVPDKRLFVTESELARSLKVIPQQGNTLSPVVRLAWDTGNLQTLTKNSPTKATGAHISILGHITRDELLRELTATEVANGFANRFLWICVRRSKELPFGGDLRDEALAPLAAQVRDAVEFARTAGEIRWHPDTRPLWVSVYSALSEGKPGMVGALLGRAEAQVVRLACIYALLDSDTQIRPEHLKAALAVWQYVEDSVRYIFQTATGSPLADEVLATLRDAPKGLTRSEINKRFHGHRSAGDLERALEQLRQSGLVVCDRQATGGRPRETWHARSAEKAEKAEKGVNAGFSGAEKESERSGKRVA